MAKLTDKLTVTSTIITDEGYLLANAVFARSGAQDYLGFELGKTGDDADKVYTSYRPNDEVFSQDSLDSYTAKPVTDGHPRDFVNASNATKYVKGMVFGDVTREDDHIVGKVIIYDADLIQEVAEGKLELSAGYYYDPVFEEGEAADGTIYQMKQTNIRVNHVAVVHNGRCGSTCKLGDDMSTQAKDCKCKDTETLTLTQVSVDSAKVSVLAEDADTLAAKIDSLEAQKVADAATIEALESKVKESQTALDSIDIDALVNARLSFVQKVNELDGSIDCSGKSDVDIMREYLFKHSSVEVANDEHVKVAFDAVANVKKAQPTATGTQAVTTAEDTAPAQPSAYEKFVSKNRGK